MHKHGCRYAFLWMALTAAAVMPITPAHADEIQLKDGRQINGKLSRSGDMMVIRKDDGGTMTVRADEVKGVTLTGASTPVEKSEVAWTKIKLAMAKSDDVHAINVMLATFVRDYPDVPLAKPAQTALTQYNQYEADGFVKFRTKWVAPAARDAVLHQAEIQAKLALTLYHNGKLKDAFNAAQDTLKTDDENTTALALAGLVSGRSSPSQWVKAKEYFQKMANVDSGNVLAWNNLAIIANIQHRAPEGLIDYKKALDAGAGNRLLLDNITQALADYKGAKDIPAYIDLTRAFAQADAQMAAIMAQKGLYRWGSTWIGLEQRDRLQINLTAIQNQMAALDASYQSAVGTYQALDQQVRQAEADYNSALSDIAALDTIIQQEQNQGYLDVVLIGRRDALAADLARISSRLQDAKAQRAATQTAIKQMRINAEGLKAQLAAAQPLYSGVQRLMEVGDVENPPPPMVIVMPPKPPVPAVIPPAPPIPPVQVIPPAIVPTPNPVPTPAAPQWPAVNPNKAGN